MLTKSWSREKGREVAGLFTSIDPENVGASSVVKTALHSRHCLRRQILLVRFWGREFMTRVAELQ